MQNREFGKVLFNSVHPWIHLISFDVGFGLCCMSFVKLFVLCWFRYFVRRFLILLREYVLNIWDAYLNRYFLIFNFFVIFPHEAPSRYIGTFFIAGTHVETRHQWSGMIEPEHERVSPNKSQIQKRKFQASLSVWRGMAECRTEIYGKFKI